MHVQEAVAVAALVIDLLQKSHHLRMRADHVRDDNGDLQIAFPPDKARELVSVDTSGIYFLEGEILMPQRAKLFKHGGSQAVRLPKEFRFEGEDEVLIYRHGDRVILEPARRTWSREFLDLAGSAPDFPYRGEAAPAEPGPDFDRE